MSKRDKNVINAHGGHMKGVVIGGITDGPTWGYSPIERPKEFKRKRLKNLGNHVLFTVTGLIEKWSKIVSTTKETKAT